MEENVTIDQWYKCKIDKKLYKELTKRSDWQAIKHVGLWIFFLVLSGYWVVATWISWWTIPALFVYVIYPIIASLRISFYEWDGFGEMTWLGFGNYIEMWHDDRVHVAFKNNLLWLVFFLLAPPLSLGLGIFLNQGFKELRFIKSFFFSFS